MADDELVLGHRDSEWCGLAPILEEDIAFANLALDEISHASLWYDLLAQIDGEDPLTYPDQLVFFRKADEFRNLQIVELPNKEWAFSILRQFLFDAYERVHLDALSQCKFAPLAGISKKIGKEEIYHYRHTSAWVRRLGQGTNESHKRMKAALETVWPFTSQLFQPSEDYAGLTDQWLFPRVESLQAAWEEEVYPMLSECSLTIPPQAQLKLVRKDHTPHLETLLSEMQSVARLEPVGSW